MACDVSPVPMFLIWKGSSGLERLSQIKHMNCFIRRILNLDVFSLAPWLSLAQSDDLRKIIHSNHCTMAQALIGNWKLGKTHLGFHFLVIHIFQTEIFEISFTFEWYLGTSWNPVSAAVEFSHESVRIQPIPDICHNHHSRWLCKQFSQV